MKRKTLIAAALAVALVCGAGITPAVAYFTDTTQATGTVEIKIGTTTTIQEWYAERVKHVTITNDADSASSVWVRAKVFAPQLSGLTYTVASDDANWVTTPDSDGWYLYKSKVAPGGQTGELLVTLTFPKVKSDTQPDGAVYGDNVSMTIVYESAEAVDANDVASYADVDWNSAKSGEGVY